MTPSPAGRTALSVVGATTALGAATLAYSLIEARCPVLRRIDVPVLAADEEPLTVLHLADLHLTDRTEARVEWVRRLAQLRPDVVVNTGDNLSLASGLEPLRRAERCAWGSRTPPTGGSWMRCRPTTSTWSWPATRTAGSCACPEWAHW